MFQWSLAASAIYDAALLGSTVAAFRWGGRDEQTGAMIMVVSSAASGIVHPLAILFHLQTRPMGLAVNLAAWLAMDALMVRSRRFWPIWMAGAQMAAVALDVAMQVWPVQARPHQLMRGKFAYVQLAALVCGALAARRRVAQDGA